MKRLFDVFRNILSERFTLTEDKEDEHVIIDAIRSDVNFKGTNLWTLIFAIFIASIGLNVNSTAVIIGAMLISPLMGPIMGIGLSIGINDLELLKRGAKNLLIAASFSVATSFIYFTITPLHGASSELLARTTPSIWDVFIAFFGGLAGIVAGTRKKKSNVIPGVAIATALMPPLCTAGFGLATGNWYFFLGATYLFFINSVFICLATFLIVKHLHFHKVEFTTPEREKRVSRYILIVVILTVIPSIYLAYRIVQKSIFESNAKTFVEHEFHFGKAQVINHTYTYDGKQRSIELLLIGQPLSEAVLDTIKAKMPTYGLKKTKLIVRQGLDAKQNIDLSEIKASILEDVYSAQHDTVTAKNVVPNKLDTPMPDLRAELKALYPTIIEYSLAPTILLNADSAKQDTIVCLMARFSHPLTKREKVQLNTWVKQRIKLDTLKVIAE